MKILDTWGRFHKKNKIMEFSIMLAGWVLADPVLHLEKYIYMVLKHFILPEMHFKANLFFPIMTP